MQASLLVLAIAALSAAASDSALDIVKHGKATTSGRVAKMSPTEIEVDSPGDLHRTIPVNEIATVLWADEPNALKAGRSRALDGNFRDALATLDKIEMTQVSRDEVKQDIEFYRAYCRAHLALAGQGKIADAGRDLAAFVKSCPDNYHWLAANELIGDLLVANGALDRAQPYYTLISKAPWPDYRLRGQAALGRVLLAQGKTDEALRYFEAVSSVAVTGEAAQRVRDVATIGKARCIAVESPDEAIRLAEDVIRRASAENVELLASAYNAIGTAQRAANKPKDAIASFLHVDLLYSSAPQAHAEALSNLVELWHAEKNSKREAEAKEALQERYPNSPWAKKSS
jgi:tetratricopeptide (TPR) repeat protein